MATIFSRIVAGEIPCYKIAEDDRFFAFLDINPLAEGHTLVIPKIETDYLFDLEDNLLGDMMIFAKRVARAIDKTTDCKRVGVAVLGLEVPHAHIHLIPINSLHDIEFSRPKLKFTKEQFLATAEKIRAALS
jgi:histidine triad (HIT) family protein